MKACGSFFIALARSITYRRSPAPRVSGPRDFGRARFGAARAPARTLMIWSLEREPMVRTCVLRVCKVAGRGLGKARGYFRNAAAGAPWLAPPAQAGAEEERTCSRTGRGGGARGVCRCCRGCGAGLRGGAGFRGGPDLGRVLADLGAVPLGLGRGGFAAGGEFEQRCHRASRAGVAERGSTAACQGWRRPRSVAGRAEGHGAGTDEETRRAAAGIAPRRRPVLRANIFLRCGTAVSPPGRQAGGSSPFRMRAARRRAP